MNSELNNYFMKPTYINGIGNIYPISLFEYDEFKTIAYEYLVVSIPKRNNLLRQQWERDKLNGILVGDKPNKIDKKSIFEFIVSLFSEIDSSTIETIKMLKENEIKFKEYKKTFGSLPEEHQNLLDNIPSIIANLELSNKESLKVFDDIIKMFEMTLKAKVVFNKISLSFNIYIEDKLVGNINNDNFEAYRKVVMEQNILYEPRIAPNLKSQEALDKEIKRKFGDGDTSTESMIAFVSCKGLNVENYTYYRLKADFTAKIREIEYMSTHIYRAMGCKNSDGSDVDMPNILEPFNFDDNPFNNLTKKAKYTEFDKQLMSK